MPVMTINVPRRSWNRTHILADLHGIGWSPDLPAERTDWTTVELTGAADKLFQVFRQTDSSVRFVGVQAHVEREPEPERLA
jgi:hypothetical protein